MKNNVFNQEDSIQVPEAVITLIGKLELVGYEAYVVGGCVRDSLLGIEPQDWDICTNAKPYAVISALSGMKVLTTGLKHGTVTVIEQNNQYEITTYRMDGEYLDGRHPEKVSFVRSLDKDLARRDFTINAMAYHPKHGLIDLYGGCSDLNCHLVRCVGDPSQRFQEDALRIMRALRFASVFAFEVEIKTSLALHQNRQLLSHISPERVSDEFQKLLLHVQNGTLLCEYSDILQVIIPALALIPEYARNEIYSLIPMVPSDFSLRFAALVCQVIDYKKEEWDENFILSQIWNRLRYSNQVRRKILEITKYRAMLPTNRYDMKRLLGLVGEKTVCNLLELCRILNMRQNFYGKKTDFDQLKFWAEDIVKKGECIRLRDLAVNGEDLKDAGVMDGKEIGRKLAFLLNLVIDDKIPNKKKELLKAAFLKQNN